MFAKQAFSLIELLLVMTIVALLSAIAVPAYERYVIKARVVELLLVANAYKVKLIEDILSIGTKTAQFALDTDLIDKISVHTLESEPVKYVVQVEAKMKTATDKGIGLKLPKNFQKPLILQLQGINVGEIITWTCHVAAIYHDYVPSNCHNNDLEELRITQWSRKK